MAELFRLLPEHRSVWVGEFNHPQKAQRTQVVHDHASFGFFIAGKARIWQGTIYSLGPGDVLIIPPGAPHRLVESKGSRLIGVAVCPSCYESSIGSELQDLIETPTRCPVRHIPVTRRPRVRRLLAELIEEVKAERPHARLASQGLLTLIITEVLRAEPLPGLPEPAETPLVADALRFVRKHALEPISLQDVAESLRKSPAHLTTVVKRETGASVVDWITHVRMDEARRLLLYSDEHVEIIAERVGYISASHFHRRFREAHGTTPAAWRRAHQARRQAEHAH
ncbi:MAG: AraC family transcriptional regulator [Myxococcota bacterium]